MYTITDRMTCVCGREIDVVAKQGTEYVSYHLEPSERKGWCPMSMIETIKTDVLKQGKI